MHPCRQSFRTTLSFRPLTKGETSPTPSLPSRRSTHPSESVPNVAAEDARTGLPSRMTDTGGGRLQVDLEHVTASAQLARVGVLGRDLRVDRDHDAAGGVVGG